MVFYEMMITAGILCLIFLWSSIDSKRRYDNGIPYRQWSMCGTWERDVSPWDIALQIFFCVVTFLVFIIGIFATP